MSHLQKNRKVLNRISRLQGQMNAMYKTVLDGEAECIDVLQQVAAVRGAVQGLMNELLEEHLKTHVLTEDYDEKELEDFLLLLKKYK
ncbi:metal/formaldehyde-sensitive transcriptional repressor [Acinetobacter populi]|jgi:DNA-binding FrmR family transcriptional regulator|uniref:Transcriptional repressor RcnR to maintain nickel and cobalt homeostasis n=1 Tax=Acinetobacter populi TaxID=1582270 RepID=A0A1Z9Z3D7_9GAMM|nr:metal/formaldehyde-sensitive transcriptional repressor [Acinetobacter populi]MCH4246736.1 metal/formaldehyde-sensitive transcriptional repressor [Acinetobacter populi]OUY08965.1 transcriptional repressor RcnR to maintain nickel and cobalt homeostasis [Acinetobacter populi]